MATSDAHGAPLADDPLVHLRELPKAAAALVVLVVCSVVAADGVPTWEAELFERINRLTDVLEPVLFLPMQLGSLFGPVLVAAGSWWFWRRWRPAVGALVVGVVAWQSAKIIKESLERGRPTDLAEEIVRRWGTPTDGLGFVSGHSAVAFALVGVVSPYLGFRWRVAAYAVATSVALARIHVGAHYPLDTVGGAATGLLLAYLFNAAVGVPRETRELALRPASGDG